MKWFVPSQRADGFKPGASFTVIRPARTEPLKCTVLSTPVPLCRWLGSGGGPTGGKAGQREQLASK